MIISYHSKGHIKLITGDVTISLAPISKESSKKVTRYSADICLIPLDHPDYNGQEVVSYGEKRPFVFKSEGEVEIKEIFINSFAEKIVRDKKDYYTNSFVFNFDGIRVLYLGQIQNELKSEHKEIIDEVDVLFIPVGGDGVSLNPYEASKIATNLEAKIIIPIDYDEKTLPIFLKEMGVQNKNYLDKLTIKKKDIQDKQGEVILLEEI